MTLPLHGSFAFALAVAASAVSVQEEFINFDQSCNPVVLGRTQGSGTALFRNNLPIAVPAGAAYLTLSMQALALDPTTGDLSSSDAWALAIGNI